MIRKILSLLAALFRRKPPAAPLSKGDLSRMLYAPPSK